MPSWKFHVAQHEDCGMMGLLMKDKGDFDPMLCGMGVAHDCLEEWPDGKDQIHDEIMALGVAIWIRGLNGYFANGNTTAENVASEWESLLIHSVQGFNIVPPTAGFKQLRNTHMEDVVQETYCQAQRMLQHWRGDPHLRANVEPLLEITRPYLRLGIMRAERRYGRYGSSMMCTIFKEIEEQVNRRIKFIEPYEVGDIYTVHVHFKRALVKITHQAAPAYSY